MVHGTGCLTCTKLRGPEDLLVFSSTQNSDTGTHDAQIAPYLACGSICFARTLALRARFTFHSSIKPNQLQRPAPKNQNSRNCSIMAHVGQNLVSFSRWRQQLERSIHFASLLHVWWERSSGTWHEPLNVNRTTWARGPFRWSFPPHKSVNKGQKHIAAHALRACSARSLSAYALRSSNHSSGSNNTNSGAPNSASRFAPLYIPQDSTCHQLRRPKY